MLKISKHIHSGLRPSRNSRGSGLPAVLLDSLSMLRSSWHPLPLVESQSYDGLKAVLTDFCYMLTACACYEIPCLKSGRSGY